MIGSESIQKAASDKQNINQYSNKLEIADNIAVDGDLRGKNTITILEDDCLIHNEEITLVSDGVTEETSSNATIIDVTHAKISDTQSPSYTRKICTKKRSSSGNKDCDTNSNSAVIFVEQQSLPSSELQLRESDTSIIHILDAHNIEGDRVLPHRPSSLPATRQQRSGHLYNNLLRSRPPPPNLGVNGVRQRRRNNTAANTQSNLITDFYPSLNKTLSFDRRGSRNLSGSDSAVLEEKRVSPLLPTSRLSSNNHSIVSPRISSGIVMPIHTPALLDALPMSSQEQQPPHNSRSVTSVSRNSGNRYNATSFRRSGRYPESNRNTHFPTHSDVVEVPPFLLYSRTLQIQESQSRLGSGGEFASSAHPLHEPNAWYSTNNSRPREAQNQQSRMNSSVYTINTNDILQPDEVTDTAQSGLSPAQISTLAFSTVCLITRDESPDCSVCMSPLDVDNMVYDIPCKHVFHIQCLTDWLTRKNSCPICRCEVIAIGDRTAHDQNSSHPTALDAQLQTIL